MLNIHPWDFWEYTYEDYILKRDGYYRGQEIELKAKLRTEFTHFRFLAYYTVYPHLKKGAQQKPWTEIVPDIYSEKEIQDPEAFQKMFEEKRKAAKKRLQKLKNIGKRA